VADNKDFRNDVAREVNAKLGAAVRARRNELAMTQGELAERIGLSRASIANIEAGEQALTVSALLNFARALVLPAEKLLAAARDGELPADGELPDEAASRLSGDEQPWMRALLIDRDASAA
jgi:transcriptional regulator with XRE-family HTH domain